MKWNEVVTVEIPEPTAEEQARHDELIAASRAMSRAAHLSLRKIARDAGLTILPGSVMYVGPRGGPMTKVVSPPEDLTVMLEGQEP